jgi:2-oxoisovalerate dehydrogenase E1 component
VSQQALKFLRAAYVRMQVIRKFEAKAVELAQADPPMIAGSIHMCAGQEAIPVGALAALRADDRVLATYRGHGWALEAGISPFELMAELCQRQGGVNGGRAGSLLANDAPRRFIGQNSIVGAGGPVACGVAIAARAQNSGRVVAVSFGDGAISQGSLHEAFVLASSEQLPVIFVCENNGWAEMTPGSYASPLPISDRAQVYGMAGATVDGCDPLAVRDAVATAAERARAGCGPTLIECNTVRLWGHYNRDIQHYRSLKDRQSAETRDPVQRLRGLLAASGVGAEELAAIDLNVESEIRAAVEQALASPHPDPRSVHEHLFAPPGAASGLDTPATAEPQKMTYATAVNRALHDAMAARDEVIVFGEDVGKPGGVFGLTRNLQKQYGTARVFDTPIAESSILGSAVGSAIEGMKPVAEIMFADFLLVALDQIINQAANVRYVSNGKASAPLVIRTQQGVTPGSCAQHSQCLEGLLASVPGLKVGCPANPQDAYSMLRAAIEDPDPCVLFEARSLFPREAEVITGGHSEEARGARLLRDGADVAVICWGTAIYPALEAAAKLSSEGLEASVLDLRWLSPLDEESVFKVVRRCGRVLVVHEAAQTGGFGAEIAARIGEKYSMYLKAPVRRLGGDDVRMPSAPVLQRLIVPSTEKILAALTELTLSRRDVASLAG